MPSAVPLVRVVRSGLVESVHLGHVAVCDADGRLMAWAGDPGRMLFARSSMKPLQAAVSLRAIGEELPDRQVAIMCASHNAEPIHLRAVRAVLRGGELTEDDLRCPQGYPLDDRAMARSRAPRRITHNCSGKHAGMLLASVRAGWSVETYRRASHPLQRRVSAAVRLGTGRDEVWIGVDGCGVPVHGMPLAAMATLYARLARPDRFGELAPWVERCGAAMLAQPYLVAGRGRTDTALMEAVPSVLCKEGAEALACAALMEPGLGVAVRIDDGSDRGAGPAVLRALHLIGALSDRDMSALDRFARPWVRGGGERVGEVVADFDLRPRSTRG
jgi:L-asparaginase II